MQSNASWPDVESSRVEGLGFSPVSPTPTANTGSSPTVSIVFANLKGNVGDLAILDAMIRQLARRYPGRVIEVFDQSRLRVDEQRFQVFRERVGAPFTYRGPLPSLPVPPSKTGHLGRIMRRVGWERQVQGRQVRWAAGQLESMVSDSGLGAHEAVFFPGGACWSGGDLAVNMFGLLQLLVDQGVKVFTFPFSVDRSVRRKNRAADLRRYFRGFAGPILVRDGLSQATLRRVGVEPTLMPDVVFSLAPLDRPKPPKRTRPRVGFAVAECQGKNRSDFERVLNQLSDGGVDPVLVTTCVPEDGDVFEALADSHDLPLLRPLGWEDAVRQLQAFDLLITNRLHGLIFSFLGGTPAIALVNREKVAGVAEDACLSQRVERIEQITADAVMGWVSNADQVVAEMTQYRSDVLSIWDDFALAPEPQSIAEAK